MKALMLVLMVVGVNSAQAKELVKSQDLFNLLRAALGQTGEVKAPVIVKFNDLKCVRNNSPTIKCRALNGDSKKEIVLNESDSNALHTFLKKRNAPFVTEPAVGAATDIFESVTCAYQLQKFPYYSCEAKGTVNLDSQSSAQQKY